MLEAKSKILNIRAVKCPAEVNLEVGKRNYTPGRFRKMFVVPEFYDVGKNRKSLSDVLRLC